MQKPLVSIIMLNWNGKENLRNCLCSIKENTLYQNHETIVVDNMSTDGSIEMLKKEFKWVKLLESPRNMGIPEATNRGFREAKGKYFFLLGNDTIVTKGWMENSVKLAESNPKISSIGSHLIRKEELGLVKPVPRCKFKDTVCTAAMLMKAKAQRNIGFYDEESFTPYGGDETDWNYRARRAGYKVVYSFNSVVVHLGSADSKKMNPKQYFLLNRNRLRAMLYNDSPITFLKRIPGLGLLFLLAIKDRSLVPLLKSYWSNLSDIPNIMKNRRMRKKQVSEAKRGQAKQGEKWF